MPKYRIPEKSFIHEHIVEAGTIIQYDGRPGSKWEVIEDAPVIIPEAGLEDTPAIASDEKTAEIPTVRRGRKRK